MKILATQRGYTLIEMAMTVGLATIVGAVLFIAISASQTQVDIADLKMTIQDSAREGLYKILQDLRQSAPDRVTLNNCNGANPPVCQSVTFTIPGVNNPNLSDGSVNWSRGESIRYWLTGSQLIRSNDTTGVQSIFANNVTGFTVTPDRWACPNNCPNFVTVSMSVQKILAKTGAMFPATPYQLASTADLRNTNATSSASPSASPSGTPTGSPSSSPTSTPSSTPTGSPSSSPTSTPSSSPTGFP